MLSFRTMASYRFNVDNNKLQVLADGVVLTDMDGLSAHRPQDKNESAWWVPIYNLSGYVGRKVTLEIVAELLDSDCTVSITNIKVDQMNVKPDVKMLSVSAVAPEGKRTDSPVSIRLFSQTSQTLRDLKVQFTVNGGEPVVEVIKELKPYAKMDYTFMEKVDLSTTNELGEVFTQWSDGRSNDLRIDADVRADVRVEALFAPASYTLTYTAAAGGSIDGDSPQTVDYGHDGIPVEAVPDAGYVFVGWSDGRTDNPRVDTNVQSDLAVEARFEPIRYELGLQVLDENAKPLAGAKVTLGSTAVATDAQGMVVDTLVPGKYAYSVELEGYIKQSGEVQLASDTLVKLVLSRATGLRGLELAPLSVHPNPTSGELWVAVPEPAEGTSELRVYGASGQLVLRVPMQRASTGSAPAAGRTRIDLSGQPAGVYIVRVGSSAAKVVRL